MTNFRAMVLCLILIVFYLIFRNVTILVIGLTISVMGLLGYFDDKE